MANYMVLQSLRDFRGERFPVSAGERRMIRFGYDKPDFVPRIVQQVRNGEEIDWGGATVHADCYRVLFDGAGPLPPEYQL